MRTAAWILCLIVLIAAMFSPPAEAQTTSNVYRPLVLLKSRMTAMDEPWLTREEHVAYQIQYHDPPLAKLLERIWTQYEKWGHDLILIDNENFVNPKGWPGDPGFISDRGEDNEQWTRRQIENMLAIKKMIPDAIVWHYSFAHPNGRYNWLARPHPREPEPGPKTLRNRMQWAMTRIQVTLPDSTQTAMMSVADVVDLWTPVFYVRDWDKVEADYYPRAIKGYGEEFRAFFGDAELLLPIVNWSMHWNREPIPTINWYNILKVCVDSSEFDGFLVNSGARDWGLPGDINNRAILRKVVSERKHRDVSPRLRRLFYTPRISDLSHLNTETPENPPDAHGSEPLGAAGDTGDETP